MIPNTKDRELISSPITASGTFGISLKDSPFIMSILRDQIYSDKIMAVLREYSANAWDAHRMIGKHDVPIKVVVPTTMAPTLIIRDYGPGLSMDDVFTVYTQYGSSTKRNDNSAVGMLGIGSKSGFAYSDSFTITSWHGGTKRIFVAALDKTEAGLINLLDEEKCSSDETGIEVQIAVKPTDALEFQSKAQKLFKYFEPRPDINVDLPPGPTEQTKLKNGTIFKQWADDQNQWTAVMGCVPYRLDLNQVRAANNNGAGVADYLFNVGGILYFDIGAVKIAASREEMKYTDDTKKAIIEKCALLVDEYVQQTFANIQSGTFSFWERRLRAQTIVAMRLPIPKEYKHITQAHIEIKHKPKKFKFTAHGATVTSISVSDDSRILLRNDTRDLTGYHLGYHDYLVEKEDTHTWEEVKVEIAAMLEKADINGMPVLDISNQYWYSNTPPKKKYAKTKNKKHLVSSFVLSPTPSFRHPYSEAWTEIEREPEKDDVFVTIDKFKVQGYANVDRWDKSYRFAAIYEEDKEIIKRLGGSMPTIYGYKTTKKKPIIPKDCTGVHYSQWRDKYIKSLLVGKQLRLYEYWLWADGADSHDNRSPGKIAAEKIRKELGASHAISKYIKKQQDAKRIFPSSKRQNVRYDYSRIKDRFFKDEEPAPAKERDAIVAGYPLLETVSLSVLWGQYAERWLEYITLIDSK
jgi:hypothetical protein